ncbi:hypothetical protein QTJ16_001622 [Diplocarpon rosae]|uniref:DUF676 domain-containing protein n=1 Tax=Diplocarpon rosae TaxID=946125 RepID=A0AAD9WGR7_9HELO|nr:hypothetical protein QTJ16_001622 [Diplocarpon rosae]
MATPAQLDEKARKDRTGATGPSLEGLATPAQLVEKAQQDRVGAAFPSDSPTPAQLAEKARPNGQSGGSLIASFATAAQLAEKPRNPGPPLPTRTNSSHAGPPPPPPYSSSNSKRSELISEQWRSRDPRSSSTHSLVPPESERDGRRTLLLVFIHGFMGNETSFQSFPAHIHNLLTIALAQTHVVHTKIYPRYKSRKAIDFARDDFSTCMGGILSAEVVFQKSASSANGWPFRHRLLGTINFDTPFLGMHPGVVVSGISSLFRPAPEPPKPRPPQSTVTSGTYTPSIDSYDRRSTPNSATSTVTASNDSSSHLGLSQSITTPIANPSPNDPFFNPPFPNDVRLPERKGWMNFLHFINKHSDGLTSATKQYCMSHLEFGGCLADYPGLKNRYERIRALEDVDDLVQNSSTGHRAPNRRVRFVNYYTASTGRSKQPKPHSGHLLDEDSVMKPSDVEIEGMSQSSPENLIPTASEISAGIKSDGVVTPQLQEGLAANLIKAQMKSFGENSGLQDDVQDFAPMQHVGSTATEDDKDFSELSAEPLAVVVTEETSGEPSLAIKPTVSEPALPPVPTLPTEPDPVDFDAYTDKDSRKIAEREHKRVIRTYQQAIKDRDSAIKERKRLVEKREKRACKEREKELKAEEKKVRQERVKEMKAEEKKRLAKEGEEKPNVTINPTSRTKQDSVASSPKDDKPKRDKKFCMLPPEYGGKRDKCWVRVYMEGMDEVGAHCGLFFLGPQYETLVGDVGERIGKWVEEDAHRRAVLGV